MKRLLETILIGNILLSGCSISLKTEVDRRQYTHRKEQVKNFEKDYDVVPLIEFCFGYSSKKIKKDKEDKYSFELR